MTLLNNSFSVFTALSILAGACLFTLPATAAETQETPEARTRKLISILQSDASPQEKAITCKKLAVFGTPEAIQAVVPLLTNEQLSSWARIALEPMPGPAADEAFRNAMEKAQGRVQVGIINSIGRRRDAKAVPALAQKLGETSPDIASAAAAALGSIGGEPAAKALEQALANAPSEVRSEIAAGCVRCAEHFMNEGKNARAVRLYDTVRKANVSKQRTIEATRGAILARGQTGLPLLMEQLKSPNKAFFSVGLRTARELPGRKVTEAIAAEMEKTELQRQTLLILVLADRGDAVALPAVKKAAVSGEKPLRLAAVEALDRMGNVSGVPVLLDIAAENDADLSQAAKVALARIPGQEVDKQLLARLPQSSGKMRQMLIELAGQRQIFAALPVIVKFAADSDAGIRGAAIASVGYLGDENQAGDLANILTKTKEAKDQADVEKAMLSITSRRGAKCLPQLLPLARHGESSVRIIALHTFASVGGPSALDAVKAAVEDQNEEVQNEAVRTLSTWPNSWPDDSSVAEPLLNQVKNGKRMTHHVLGVRGYLQYVQGDKKLSAEDKTSKFIALMPSLKRAEEKKQTIAAMGTAPTAAALETLIPLASDATVGDDACSALVTLAAKNDLKGGTKELRKKALETAIEKAGSDTTKRKAQRALESLQ